LSLIFLKNFEFLKEKERLAAIGEAAGWVKHDIHNPVLATVSEL